MMKGRKPKNYACKCSSVFLDKIIFSKKVNPTLVERTRVCGKCKHQYRTYESIVHPQTMVRHFQQRFDLICQGEPLVKYPGFQYYKLWERLIQEEFDELKAARFKSDSHAIADALGDLIYVVYGLVNLYGFNMDRIFNEIHKANMAKEGGPKRADGKVLKPEGWVPPDLTDYV